MAEPLQSTAYQWRAVARNLGQVLALLADDRTKGLTSAERVELSRCYKTQCEAHRIPENER